MSFTPHAKLGQIKTDLETLEATDSAPTGDEGVDCYNKTHVLVTFAELTNVTDFSVQLWVKVGDNWSKVKDGAFATITDTWAEVFEPQGAERFFAQVSAINAAGSPSLKRRYVASKR